MPRARAHSVLVDYDVFVNVTMPDKSDPQRLYKPDGLDFRLKPGSAAVDAGIALPSINDDYTGKAPDIGAYELGRPLPHYGPRQERVPVSAEAHLRCSGIPG